MNVRVLVEPTLRNAHDAAIGAVNEWRGHCVERYARLEFDVTETLSAMAAVPGTNVSVPHNFGEKVKKLRAAIDSGGPFAHPKIAKALDEFTDHLGRRNLLVHATGKVWIDSHGDWLWHYRFQPSGKGRALEIGSFEQRNALQIEKALSHDSQSLGDQLRALRTKVVAVTK